MSLNPFRWDELKQHLLKTLPGPVREELVIDGSTILIGGDPGEVVVNLSLKGVTISLHEVEWQGQTPMVRPRHLASFRWDRLPEWPLGWILENVIRSASEMRRATYKQCKYCKQVCPPEWMDGGSVCHGCQERVLGIVH